MGNTKKGGKKKEEVKKKQNRKPSGRQHKQLVEGIGRLVNGEHHSR
jgi:hypothetical protein